MMKFLLPFFFAVIVILGLLFPKTSFETTKQNVLANPNDLRTRAFLAQQLFSVNRFGEAERELLITQNLKLKTQNGSEWENEREKIREVKELPKKVRNEVLFWQKITEEMPGYRDAYIKLAILSWKIHRDFDAKKYLSKALEIDPNNESALKFLKELK